MEKKESVAREILEFLILTGGVSLLLMNPAFLAPAILLARHLPQKRLDKKEITNALYYLKKRKYITVNSKRNTTSFSLTRNGTKRAKVYAIESRLMGLKNGKKSWKGLWYIVIFDIKDDIRVKRDALRRVLQRSGFKLLQKSVWVYPYDCRSEINFVKSTFAISDEECRVIISQNIGGDSRLKKEFKLS